MLHGSEWPARVRIPPMALCRMSSRMSWLCAPVCLPTCPPFPQWALCVFTASVLCPGCIVLLLSAVRSLSVKGLFYCFSVASSVSLAWVSLLFMNTYQPKINSWLLFWLGFPLRLHLAAHFHTNTTTSRLFVLANQIKSLLFQLDLGLKSSHR